MTDETWFERFGEPGALTTDERAPANLKARVYSAFVARMAETGPLRDLRTVKETGGDLCMFENALALLPLGAELQSKNPCRVCHARVLGERMTHAPIFWSGCPYADFHKE
jgi:hypothetical protein